MKCQAYMYFNHHDGHVYVCMYMTPIHTAQSSEYIGYVNNIWIENKLKPLWEANLRKHEGGWKWEH